MTLKSLMEALKTDVNVIVKESDNTTIATFNRDSYKAISDTYLKREIDDVELLSKSAITMNIVLQEAPASITDPGQTDEPSGV